MQVNSVSNYSLSPAFKASPQEQLFANLSDDDLKKLAYAKASNDVNDKKHRRIDKALYYSLPVAAGLGVAARKFTGNHARLNRLGAFAGTTIGWAAGLAALDAIWGSKNLIAKKSQKANDFFNNNPVLTTIATMAAGVGAILAVDKYGFKAVKGLSTKLEQYLFKKHPKTLETLANREVKVLTSLDKKLNTSKVINKAAEVLDKAPAPIKEIGKAVIDWAPWIVVGTQIAHSFGHENVKAKETAKDYSELVKAQSLIREDLAAEEA